MFEAIGDREQQDIIREEKHCKLLVEDSEACRGCSFNPYEMDKKKSPIKGWAQLAGEAEDLLDLFNLGLQTEFTPYEFAMLRTAYHFNKNKDIEIQGDYIAGKISQILGKMFSK